MAFQKTCTIVVEYRQIGDGNGAKYCKRPPEGIQAIAQLQATSSTGKSLTERFSLKTQGKCGYEAADDDNEQESAHGLLSTAEVYIHKLFDFHTTFFASPVSKNFWFAVELRPSVHSVDHDIGGD
jgi:hypothetical protein